MLLNGRPVEQRVQRQPDLLRYRPAELHAERHPGGAGAGVVGDDDPRDRAGRRVAAPPVGRADHRPLRLSLHAPAD